MQQLHCLTGVLWLPSMALIDATLSPSITLLLYQHSGLTGTDAVTQRRTVAVKLSEV